MYGRYKFYTGTRGSVFGYYATSQKVAGRFPMRSLNFSLDLIFPAALWPWGLLRNLSGGKGRPAREADNLTAMCINLKEVKVVTARQMWRIHTIHIICLPFILSFHRSAGLCNFE
jgi:hypothetical protein